jgi:outer membrane protein assembly factor BamD
MFIKMRNLLFLAGIVLFFASCNEYQKALKSEETKVKYDLAEKLYNEGDYRRAIRLFEQILPEFVGRPQGERVLFFYADALFKRDSYLAGYQFERFVKAYPKSDKAEEAAFFGAKSYYKASPKFSIDQADTYTAIEKLQVFINTYPDSERVAEANTMVKELTTKLEKKAYEIAKLFHFQEDWPSAIKSLSNFVLDNPGSVYREDALYYRLDAAHTYAINSVRYRMEERLLEAQEYAVSFQRYFPESKYKEEVDAIVASINQHLQQFSK